MRERQRGQNEPMDEKERDLMFPGQRLGKELWEDAKKRFPDGAGGPRDGLGPYTGLAVFNKPLRMLDEVEYASPRLSPEFFGARPTEPGPDGRGE